MTSITLFVEISRPWCKPFAHFHDWYGTVGFGFVAIGYLRVQGGWTGALGRCAREIDDLRAENAALRKAAPDDTLDGVMADYRAAWERLADA